MYYSSCQKKISFRKDINSEEGRGAKPVSVKGKYEWEIYQKYPEDLGPFFRSEGFLFPIEWQEAVVENPALCSTYIERKTTFNSSACPQRRKWEADHKNGVLVLWDQISKYKPVAGACVPGTPAHTGSLWHVKQAVPRGQYCHTKFSLKLLS